MHHEDHHAILRVATARRLHRHRQEGSVHQSGGSSSGGSLKVV
jgi:hypothetical protein